MESGYVIIFENSDQSRGPSALVHRTKEAAQKAWDRGGQKGKPLAIIEIAWDDSKADKPWG